ncbi:RNA polymerase sigma factor [Brevundimonas variabilis]|uniref:RNA polymerase sigma-70 factor (ECF subfamily) n=1 Tax=Brevundimonas variabilis TaxID=74312 RepID=A0A7W9CHG5_9CAUL|nr:RNA polymerase sigma factor [Brevundimonas variabilis]MBB5745710.1 RNA polymerase sigma-70 factor (ECF subfamily) [Brevundimonas variabilis]
MAVHNSHPVIKHQTATELYVRHSEWLKNRLAKRYGADEADEVSQETWLRMVPHPLLEDIDHPKAWLLTIASNVARNMGLKRGVRQKYAMQALVERHEQASQLTEVLAQQLLLGLPVPLRDVFVLSRIVGLSNAQIAEQLGISPKTVEGRMTKALAHCAAQLRR